MTPRSALIKLNDHSKQRSAENCLCFCQKSVFFCQERLDKNPWIKNLYTICNLSLVRTCRSATNQQMKHRNSMSTQLLWSYTFFTHRQAQTSLKDRWNLPSRPRSDDGLVLLNGRAKRSLSGRELLKAAVSFIGSMSEAPGGPAGRRPSEPGLRSTRCWRGRGLLEGINTSLTGFCSSFAAFLHPVSRSLIFLPSSFFLLLPASSWLLPFTIPF